MPPNVPQLKLMAFWHPPGQGWRTRNAVPGTEIKLEHYIHVAQAAERGKMDAIFFQDNASISGMRGILSKDPGAGSEISVARLEPMTLLPALAMVTKSLGLIATGTTTYNEPYHIARRFASIDHISGGRAGWNLVTSQSVDEAQNFGFDEHWAHADRYERANEFYDVVAGLWDSWDEGGVVEDKQNGVYFDLSKLHVLNHRGKYFKVRGPLNVPRTPQGRPIVAQAGSSEPGRELAARTADCVFTAQTTLEDGQAFYRDVKGRMAKYGRDRNDLKILPGIVPILGATEAEAREHYLLLQEGISEARTIAKLNSAAGGLDLNDFPLDGPLPDLPPSNAARARQELLVNLARRDNLSIRELARVVAIGSGHRVVWGTAKTIADTMQDWFDQGGCDGFNIIFPYFPRGIDDFVDLVIPELQRRGIFRTEYEGKTLRENLGVSFPKSRYDRDLAVASDGGS